MPPRKRPPAGYTSSVAGSPRLSQWRDPFLHYLRSECGSAANTVTAYASDLQKFLDWHAANGSPAPEAIDLAFLGRYLAYLHERCLKPSSAGRHLVTIKMFFRYLVLENILPDSIVEQMNSPKLWQNLPKVLSPEMVNRLLAAPGPTDSWPLRDRALLCILYATGCRASEVTSLSLRDLHLSEGWCRCLGKGDKERIVHLNSIARHALEAYLGHERPRLAARGELDLVFVTKTGRPLSRITLWNLVKKYAARAGCRGEVSPHTLRHSFATHMLAGGAEIRALQELLGHSNIATTQIYTHVEHSRLKSVHEKFHPRG